MHQYQLTFIELALQREALRFGTFTLKSGRESPYFFNAGRFSDGESAAVLGSCYAAAVTAAGLGFDMVFGPAYKGIPLATATVVALAREHGRSVPYAFNRKEAKDHGEGGRIVGAPLARPGADHRRRDHRGYRGARVARDHPRGRRAAGGRGTGARPSGARPGRALRGPGGRAASTASGV